MREGEETTIKLHSCCFNISKGWPCNEPKSPYSNFCKKHHQIPLPQPSKPPNFTVNQLIEVTSEHPSFKHSWFPAKILKILLPNKTQFLIQYLHNGFVKIVALDLIRPNPPPLSNSFKLHQIVDAFYCNGWWKGVIVAYLEELDLYTVYFEVWDMEFRFKGDELRLHLICVGWKWMDIDVRREEIYSQCDERKRKIRQSLPRERPWKKIQKDDAREGFSSEVATRTLLVTTKTGLCTSNCMDSDFSQWNNGNESEEEALVRNKKDTGHNSTDILTNTCTTNCVDSDFNQRNDGNGREEEALVRNKNDTGHDSTDILTTRVLPIAWNQWNYGRESEEVALVRNKKDTGHDSTDILTNTCTTNCMDSDFNQLDDARESEEEDLVQDTGHDFTDILTNPSIESSDYQRINVCRKDTDFPFIKSLPLWKTFETMEVFLSMPQNPHFRPLAKVNKSLREGTAIGYMASFVTVVENIRNALVGASVYDYVEALKAVKELEDMGFDVHFLRARMDKLLSIKTATLKLDAELKQVETQINKDKLKEESLQSDISEMDKKIAELHERSVKMKKLKQVILMKRLAKDSNITALQKSIQTLEEELRDTVLRFNSAAACPW